MPSKSSDTRLESSKVPSFCFFKGGNLKKKKKGNRDWRKFAVNVNS